MRSIKVSIQIPTYNQEKLIVRALDSALSQTYKNIEVVIADDCSDDSTETIVKKYADDRVKYFRNKKNLGRVGNYRNSLHNYCTGDWVVNLDGDDYFTDRHFISDAVASILCDENVVLYMAQNSSIDTISKITKTEIVDSKLLIDGLKFLENYSNYPCFFHLACVYNRDIALRKNFYDIDCLTSDFVSIMKLADKGNFVISEKTVGKWDVSNNSASQSLNKEKNLKNIEGLNRLMEDLKFTSSYQERKIHEELWYVNRYHLVSATASRKDFFSSLSAFIELADFRKKYYWKGLLGFLIKG